MANVIIKVLGSQPKDASADTVGELKSQLGLTSHSANVNGSAQSDDFQLSDGQLVTFAPNVKGGNK